MVGISQRTPRDGEQLRADIPAEKREDVYYPQDNYEQITDNRYHDHGDGYHFDIRFL